jgi:hypothetical protein
MLSIPFVIALVVFIWFLIKTEGSLKLAKELERRKAEQKFTDQLSNLKESPENYAFLVKSNNMFITSESGGWYKTDFYGALNKVLATCDHPRYRSYTIPSKFCLHIVEAEKRVYVVPRESSFNMSYM